MRASRILPILSECPSGVANHLRISTLIVARYVPLSSTDECIFSTMLIFSKAVFAALHKAS